MMIKRFFLDGEGPKILGEIARDVVSNYANRNPKTTAQQIRNYLQGRCVAHC